MPIEETSPRRALSLALCVLAGLCGCRSTPAVAVDTPWGLARADDAAGAQALAEMLAGYGPRVRALLPDARPIDPEVWLDDFSEPALAERPDVVGLSSRDRGRIRIRADRLGHDADFVLVHELVHALLGDSWEPLPALIKEGLCDALASRLAVDSAASVRALRLLDAATLDEDMALELSWFEHGGMGRERLRIPLAERRPADRWSALARPGEGVRLHQDDHDPLYGAGWLVAERAVSRVGVDGLHRLCLAASAEGLAVVPLDWLLEAAALSREPAAWRAAVLELVGDAELRHQCEALAPQLAGWIATSLRPRFPGLDGAAFLRRALPTLGWEGGRPRLALASVPGMDSELAARWDAADSLAVREGDHAATGPAPEPAARRLTDAAVANVARHAFVMPRSGDLHPDPLWSAPSW